MLRVEFRNLVVELCDKWHGNIPSSMVTLRSMGQPTVSLTCSASNTQNFRAMTQSAFAFQSTEKADIFSTLKHFSLFYGFLS